jgi:hypothetical protein
MSSPNAKASYSLVSKLLIGIHQRVSHNHRISRLIEELQPRIPTGAAVLDPGCGDMKLLAGLGHRRELARCVGADIWPQRVCPPSGCEYVQIRPGGPFPWLEQEFDVVLLIDTLHHTDAPGLLLGQALAVGRKVVVKDHFEYGLWSRTLLRLMDVLGNFGYGVSIPKRYFTQQGFKELVARIAPGHRCRLQVGLDLYGHIPAARLLLPPALHFIAELSPDQG